MLKQQVEINCVYWRLIGLQCQGIQVASEILALLTSKLKNLTRFRGQSLNSSSFHLQSAGSNILSFPRQTDLNPQDEAQAMGLQSIFYTK